MGAYTGVHLDLDTARMVVQVLLLGILVGVIFAGGAFVLWVGMGARSQGARGMSGIARPTPVAGLNSPGAGSKIQGSRPEPEKPLPGKKVS